MNKYVVYTSLAWLAVLAAVVSLFLYRSFSVHRAVSATSETEPVAAGPPVPASAINPETPLAPIQLTPEGMRNIGVETAIVQRKQVTDHIRAAGTIEIDERLVAYAQVRVAGYIRKVFANAIYQYVKKGDPLFTIYSPDLMTTEQDFLLALQQRKRMGASSVEGVASGAEELADAAEARLRQWEVPQSEIAKIKKTGIPIADLTIESPASGYITELTALPNMYVTPGMRLFTIADLSRVWVNAEVFQSDVGRLKPGDAAQISVDAYPGAVFAARVGSILPQVNMATRTLRVRLEIDNPGIKLKPGMFVNVDLMTNLGRQLVVPASAVFQSGTRQLVFLNPGGGSLDPQEVVLGPRVGDDFIVLKGVKAGEKIAASAGFLIDSESQLQAAAGSYTPPPPGSGGMAATNQPSQSAQASVDFTTVPSPPHKGTNTFRAKLSGPGGAAIDGAEVTVTFFMAAMPAMGMAAMKTTTKLPGKGNGLYEGPGILESGGSWQVAIAARKDGKTLANKVLRVNAEGGM